MDRWDLSAEQCEKILEVVGPALGYLSKLRRRIDQQSFPLDDKLRQDVERAQAAMQALRMTLHYLSCDSGVFQNRPKR